jgi:hypothetical protein
VKDSNLETRCPDSKKTKKYFLGEIVQKVYRLAICGDEEGLTTMMKRIID